MALALALALQAGTQLRYLLLSWSHLLLSSLQTFDLVKFDCFVHTNSSFVWYFRVAFKTAALGKALRNIFSFQRGQIEVFRRSQGGGIWCWVASRSLGCASCGVMCLTSSASCGLLKFVEYREQRILRVQIHSCGLVVRGIRGRTSICGDSICCLNPFQAWF